MRSAAIARFWAKVAKGAPDECWLWGGTTSPNRRGVLYGYTGDGAGNTVRAHRFIYAHTHGPIPTGLVIRHKCDTPLCVNPDHLEIGTHKDNVRDRYDRGRANHVRGSAHGIAKLNEEKVRDIKDRIKRGEGQRSIARAFGVDQTSISLIARGKQWTHV